MSIDRIVLREASEEDSLLPKSYWSNIEHYYSLIKIDIFLLPLLRLWSFLFCFALINVTSASKHILDPKFIFLKESSF